MAYRSFSLSGFEARGVRKVMWLAFKSRVQRPWLVSTGASIIGKARWVLATLSNCGEALKLCQPSQCGKPAGGPVNDLGYGKIGRDRMGPPQSIVGRLPGNGQSAAKLLRVCVVY